jgi:hypothetical protein
MTLISPRALVFLVAGFQSPDVEFDNSVLLIYMYYVFLFYPYVLTGEKL